MTYRYKRRQHHGHVLNVAEVIDGKGNGIVVHASVGANTQSDSKNTRIPVSLIVACLKDEMTFQEICEEYKIAPEGVEKVMEAIGNFLKSKGDSIKNTYYAVKKKGDSYEIIRRFPKL